MAIYKLDIQKQFGTFQHRLYKQGDKTPEYAGADKTLNDMKEAVKGSLEGAGVGKDDEVVFRAINYERQFDLLEAVRTAPY